jgi:hypothetical protein
MALGLGTLGKVGKTMMNAPGMGPIRKPLAKGMQATPGLKGIGKGIGLGPSKVRPPSTVGEPLGPIYGQKPGVDQKVGMTPQQGMPFGGGGMAARFGNVASQIGNQMGFNKPGWAQKMPDQMQQGAPIGQMQRPAPEMGQQAGYMGGQQLQDAMGAGQPVQDDQQAQIEAMRNKWQQFQQQPQMGGGFGMRRPMPFQRGMMGQGMGLGPRQPMMQNMMRPMQMQQQEPEMY